jgi:hypothetical protein
VRKNSFRTSPFRSEKHPGDLNLIKEWGVDPKDFT